MSKHDTKQAKIIEEQIQKLDIQKRLVVARIDKAIAALRVLATTTDLIDLEFSTPVSSQPIEVRHQPSMLDVLEEEEPDNGSDEPELDTDFPNPLFREGTLFDRCSDFFLSTGNRPATNAEIRRAIGSNRGSVAMVLYNTHAAAFEKVVLPDSHLIHWRLNEPGLKMARRKQGKNTEQNNNSAN